MQLEIDNLKKKLHYAWQKRTPSSSDVSSNDEEMIIIGEGRKLHQAKLSPTMKSTIINVDIRARLVKAWEMTP